MAPGILWVGTPHRDPQALPNSTFNKWYDELHLGDILASGVTDFAIRFKNLNPDAHIQYTATYRIAGMAGTPSPEFVNIPKGSDLLPNTHDWRNEVSRRRAYELTQRFEGLFSISQRAGAIVSVFMTPAGGADKEFDE